MNNSGDEKIKDTNFIQVVPMSEAERLKMYMKTPKIEIAKMLINCNKILEQMKPIMAIGAKAYNNIVPDIVMPVSGSADKKKKQIINIFRWLMGYTDFPERKTGEGAYYWRNHLDKKLKRIGINVHNKRHLR